MNTCAKCQKEDDEKYLNRTDTQAGFPLKPWIIISMTTTYYLALAKKIFQSTVISEVDLMVEFNVHLC